MLFNSYAFIFLFLPVALLGYLAVGRLQSRNASLSWLVLVSVVFYGAWNWVNVAIILPSIAINFALGLGIRRQLARGESGETGATWLLRAGLAFNLAFLGYFKYRNFFVDSTNEVLGTHFPLIELILPLGISFITFQKIAFLVDVRSGTIKDFALSDFLVFVFFFPQLIAGPIVHYREMMPQFARMEARIDPRNLATGLSLFAIGLFKKVVLADGIAAHASPVFAAADSGAVLSFVPAWTAALAYTFQIYFDFSGYSDMAIGLARLFGIRLPANFNSPLKSVSIIEFWSRWHITLTRFLTAYVYTPVVMSLTRSRMQRGKAVVGRKQATAGAFLALVAWPTVLTMFLSGFWHGAGVTFIVWGLMHGAYLCINHAWRQWRPRWDKATYERRMKPVGAVLTFLAVVAAMVLFRARTMAGAGRLLHAMLGLDGVSLPESFLVRLGGFAEMLHRIGVESDVGSGVEFVTASIWVIALFAIVVRAPNSLELLRDFEPALLYTPPPEVGARPAMRLRWSPSWALVIAASFVLGALGLNRVSEFLYWQF